MRIVATADAPIDIHVRLNAPKSSAKALCRAQARQLLGGTRDRLGHASYVTVTGRLNHSGLFDNSQS